MSTMLTIFAGITVYCMISFVEGFLAQALKMSNPTLTYRERRLIALVPFLGVSLVVIALCS